MKVFVPCRYGLGDVVSGYFCPITNGQTNERARLFARLANAIRSGACTSAFTISEFHFWECLDFPLRNLSVSYFDVALPQNGFHIDLVEGHHNLLRAPTALLRFPDHPIVPVPQRKPIWPIPSEYILFSDGAGAADRALDDLSIIDWLRTYLPVVRVGGSQRHGYSLPMGSRGATSAAVDLTNRSDLTEIFWLAQRARLIVAPPSYLRIMSSLVGTPVVEFAQENRIHPMSIARTRAEYAGHKYGMRPGETNFWYIWSGRPRAEAQRQVEKLISRPR